MGILVELCGGPRDGETVDLSGEDVSEKGRLTIMFKTEQGDTYLAKSFKGKIVLFFRQDRRIK